MARRSEFHAPSSVLGFFMKSVLVLLLLWSAWQTWLFVNWLFPDDELPFRFIALISFDGMALLWLAVLTFYRFMHHKSKTWVMVASGTTGTLAVLASFLYLSIQGFFRFHLAITPDMYDVGIGASLLALFANILFLMRIVSWEKEAESEYRNNRQRYTRRKNRNAVTPATTQVSLSNAANVTALPSPSTQADVIRAQTRARVARHRAKRRGFIA